MATIKELVAAGHLDEKHGWIGFFDERQRKQIIWCELYAEEFGHGDDGHNNKLIIAKLTRLLNEAVGALIEQKQKDPTGSSTSSLTG